LECLLGLVDMSTPARQSQAPERFGRCSNLGSWDGSFESPERRDPAYHAERMRCHCAHFRQHAPSLVPTLLRICLPGQIDVSCCRAFVKGGQEVAGHNVSDRQEIYALVLPCQSSTERVTRPAISHFHTAAAYRCSTISTDEWTNLVILLTHPSNGTSEGVDSLNGCSVN